MIRRKRKENVMSAVPHVNSWLVKFSTYTDFFCRSTNSFAPSILSFSLLSILSFLLNSIFPSSFPCSLSSLISSFFSFLSLSSLCLFLLNYFRNFFISLLPSFLLSFVTSVISSILPQVLPSFIYSFHRFFLRSSTLQCQLLFIFVLRCLSLNLSVSLCKNVLPAA